MVVEGCSDVSHVVVGCCGGELVLVEAAAWSSDDSDALGVTGTVSELGGWVVCASI